MDRTTIGLLTLKKDQTMLLVTPVKNMLVKVIDDNYKFKTGKSISFMCIDEANEIPKEVWDKEHQT